MTQPKISIVISGPAGVGKSGLAQFLQELLKGDFHVVMPAGEEHLPRQRQDVIVAGLKERRVPIEIMTKTTR